MMAGGAEMQQMMDSWTARRFEAGEPASSSSIEQDHGNRQNRLHVRPGAAFRPGRHATSCASGAWRWISTRSKSARGSKTCRASRNISAARRPISRSAAHGSGCAPRCSRASATTHGPLPHRNARSEGCDISHVRVDRTPDGTRAARPQRSQHVSSRLLPRELRGYGRRRKRLRRGVHRIVEGAADYRHALLHRTGEPHEPPGARHSHAATRCARYSISIIGRCSGA